MSGPLGWRVCFSSSSTKRCRLSSCRSLQTTVAIATRLCCSLTQSNQLFPQKSLRCAANAIACARPHKPLLHPLLAVCLLCFAA